MSKVEPIGGAARDKPDRARQPGNSPSHLGSRQVEQNPLSYRNWISGLHSFQIDFRWRVVPQRLVWPFVIIPLYKLANLDSRLTRAGVLFGVNLFVLDRPPEPLGENVVERPTFSIHADSNTRIL